MPLQASKSDYREILQRGFEEVNQKETASDDQASLIRAMHEYRTIFGIIDSMTPAERDDPIATIDSGRMRRIARGAGAPDQQVLRFLISYHHYLEVIARHNFHERRAEKPGNEP